MCYIIQYSISNLNAFMLILTIGYSIIVNIDNAKSTENFGEQQVSCFHNKLTII